MSLIVNIQKQLQGFRLKVSFESSDDSLGLLGASGCGKSLTLKCIAGIVTPDSGKIVLNGITLFDSEKGINLPVQQRNVGMLFQNYALFPHMTVKNNIEIGLRNKKEKQFILTELIRIFRLEGMLYKYPHQLSGGEQQRVALARSLVLKPDLLMLDEPFYALDSHLKEQLMQELKELLKDYQGKLIMVSHSREELFRFCRTIAVIHEGQMIERGSRMEIFHRPVHMSAARLTGCRNFSRVEKISDFMVRALDWKLLLHTERFVMEDICYVGIRAHSIKAGTREEKENLVQVEMTELTEGPYEYNLLLKNSLNPGEHSILWSVPKQEWFHTLHGKPPSFIQLPKEELLLLTDHPQID